MKLQFENNAIQFSFDSSKYFDISIPLDFDGDQPNTYNVPKATATPYKDGTFIGDTRLGGSCNFQSITIVPHCNGTHTECIGHISNERKYIAQVLNDSMFSAKLISIPLCIAENEIENYEPKLNSKDMLITRKEIKNALQSSGSEFVFDTLIIRTLPNLISKKSQNYLNEEPAFLSKEAAEYLSEIGINHLVLDVPSLDRTFDEGMLTSHHIFWNVEPNSNEINSNSHLNKTITEMAFIETEIADGDYIVNIQITPFVSDASPSRLLLYPIFELKEN